MINPEQERSRRFDSEKNAKSFSEKVKGDFKDLRGNENRKSDFKVTYTKENAHNGMSKNKDLDYYENDYDQQIDICDMGGPIPNL